MGPSFGARVDVSVQGGEAQTPGLPEFCATGVSASAVYLAREPGHPGNQTDGQLLIQGFDPVPFAVAHTKLGATFVGALGRWRYTNLGAESWDWRSNGDKPTCGRAADLELSGALLQVRLRDATPAELKRCLQMQALRDAQAGDNYDTLHAQLAKARLAGVDREALERAEERLKDMRKQGLHVHEGCSKDDLRAQMTWSRVSRRTGAEESEVCCSANADCPCNERENPGEVLSIVPGAVEAILGSGADHELYHALLEAALTCEEGSVWPAGGKLIFSAFDRNQSVIALVRMLETSGSKRCSKMLLDLVKSCTET
ncbi:unnamed protein product [Polarella glacialis]|uniref:Uncharacterized protein n=1 Tax=Polarella glacialis TaxID=89957 RepID=A0A813L924_POLGL|nr:unnamed protein product [Polarella glacialis]